jgi:hypothetical protein
MDLPEPPRPDRRPPPPPPPTPKKGFNPSRGTTVAIVIASLIGLGLVINAFDKDSGSDTDQQKENSQEVCAEVRAIAADADILMPSELRTRFQEVYDGNDIVLASIPIRDAVRDLLSALTSEDIDAFERAVDNVDNQCSLVGA